MLAIHGALWDLFNMGRGKQVRLLYKEYIECSVGDEFSANQ